MFTSWRNDIIEIGTNVLFRGGEDVNHGWVLQELDIIAQAKKLSDRLEEYRDEYIQSLYDDIRLFSYPMGDYLTEERQASPDTAFQAMEIMSKKEAYDKRISKLKRQYSQWQDVLNQFDTKGAAVLRSYFEEGERSFFCDVQPLLPKVSEILDKQHKVMEKELDKEAADRFREYQRTNRSKQPKPKGKQYFVGDRFVYMTEEEHERHLKTKATRSSSRLQRFNDLYFSREWMA